MRYLKDDLSYLGLLSYQVDTDDPNDVYVKIGFKWKYKNDNEIFKDGRKEFLEIGNSEDVYNEIIRWIKEDKGDWEILLD